MNKIRKTVLVAHSAANMFKLVDDIDNYPNFLPWCSEVNVLTKTNAITKATIHINFKGIKQSFTTSNTKKPPNSMHIKLVNGPFKSLYGQWQFIALSANGCKIVFELNYEFANHILEKLISPVFNHIAKTFVDSFVQQADKTYNTQG